MAAKKFTREALLMAPEFLKYQRDFLAVVLCNDEYTPGKRSRPSLKKEMIDHGWRHLDDPKQSPARRLYPL